MTAAVLIAYLVLGIAWGTHVSRDIMHQYARGVTCWLWLTAQAALWPLSMLYWAIR